MKIVLTGGGSGGHVSPALAVAGYLRQHHPDIDLLYIGGTMTMEGSTGPSVEQRLVEPTGIPFVTIHSGKLKRDTLASLAVIGRLWGVVPGCAEAYRILRRARPNVVFSSGGYVAVPVVLAAAALRIPVVIHEQTAVVGLANQIGAKVATKVAVTFAQSAQYFPQAKVVVTGNPLNQSVLHPNHQVLLDSPLATWLKQSSELPLVYVTGGGLGSHVINQTIEQLLPDLLGQVRFVHQTGSHHQFQDFERLSAQAQQFDPAVTLRYWPARHLTADEVGAVYDHCQLVIARSGANTVLELAAKGLPAIFIPIPWVTHDEQTRNAEILVAAGTATILPEAELSPDRLQQEIIHRLATPPDTEARERAATLVDPQATQKLVQLVMSSATSA